MTLHTNEPQTGAVGLYLRLAAPLQSWGVGGARPTHVGTAPSPTRSALLGLLAATLGVPRPTNAAPQLPQWLHECRFVVRTDRPGTVATEYSTINIHDDERWFRIRLHQAMNGGKSATGVKLDRQAFAGPWAGVESSTTTQIWRDRIDGATFTVEVTHPDPGRVNELAGAAGNPAFAPYLGRKAYPVTAPFLLGVGPSGLLEHAPVAGQPSSGPGDWFTDTGDDREVSVLLADVSASSRDQRWVRVNVVDSTEWAGWWRERTVIGGAGR